MEYNTLFYKMVNRNLRNILCLFNLFLQELLFDHNLPTACSMSLSSPRRPVCSLSQFSGLQLLSGGFIDETGGSILHTTAPNHTLDMYISPDQVRSTRGCMENVFASTEQTTAARFYCAWRSGDLMSLLGETLSERHVTCPAWIRRVCSLIVKLASLPAALVISPSDPSGPNHPGSGGKSVVRRVSWHPHTARLALLLRDDSVRVYQQLSDRTAAAAAGHQLLQHQQHAVIKHRRQRNARDLDWKRHSASVLAVACDLCILVFRVDSTAGDGSAMTRPAGSATQILTASGHTPVTSVQWCPLGDLLVSASARDPCLLVWHVAMETHVALTRVSRAGNTFCRWSPDARRVLAATTDHTFRVWDADRWTVRKWKTPGVGGRLSACCWSSDGNTLLFSTSADTMIYSASFTSALLDESSTVPVAVLDTTPSLADWHCSAGVRVGGLVTDMAWDPSSRRLAVSFGDSPVVTIFSTQLSPGLRLQPCGVVCGEAGDLPVYLQFQQNLWDCANLTVCWSGGRVQQVAMLLPNSRESPTVSGDAFAASQAPSAAGAALYTSTAAGILSPPQKLHLFSLNNDSP